MLCSTPHSMVLSKWVTGILQMRLYALYRCSKKLLVFMMIGFAGEAGSTTWMVISTNLSSCGTLLAFIETLSMIHSDCCGKVNIRVPDFIPGRSGDRSMYGCSLWSVRVASGSLSRFRGYVMFTCYLCWCQTPKGTIRVVVNENQQTATD